MARIEASIEIAAPPAVVFRFCHDLDRWPEWDERVVGVEPLTGKPIRTGSLIRIDAGRSGQYRFTWDAEYTSYQYPSGSTLKVLDAAPGSPFRSGTETWQFTKTAEGTRFTLIWNYQPRGIIARITDALGRRAGTRRAIQHSLANLQALLETD
jgi:uncharacterized protein YndB with AHSA1/START domain